MPEQYKEYIGDGVYAYYDGFNIVLTVEDGISVTNTIFLEPSVWENACRYVEGVKDKLARAILEKKGK